MTLLCRGCSLDKPESDFYERNDRSGRLRPYCKICCNNIARARYKSHREGAPFKHKCARAKARASWLKVPFDLTPEYLESIWTGYCPVLNVPIHLSGDRSDEYVAELDRFRPDVGYVKGNVAFLSRRINRLKNNVSVVELEQLIKWMKDFDNS